MVYKINLRFRRFFDGMGHPTGLSVYYIAFFAPQAPGGSSDSGPQDLAKISSMTRPATISPCTFTMDHNAIVCFMVDRLTRGPDKDVHVPSVGSQKYPSYNVDVIYL